MNIRFNPDLYQLLLKEANERNVSIAALVNSLLREALI